MEAWTLHACRVHGDSETMIKKLAIPLFIVGSLSYACSGGGGGGGNNIEPCCSAGGQTDAPPAGGGFAFAGGGGVFIEERLAEAVVISSSSCISMDDPLLLLPEFEAVSETVVIDPAGLYTLELDERAIGQEVAVRIFDRLSNGSELVRGVSLLAKRPVADPEGTSVIPVAPILFEGRVFAETTIEAAAYCEMRRSADGTGDELQNLELADIRAVITSEFALSFTPGGNRAAVLARIKHYRHAVNGLVDPTKNGGFDVKDQMSALRADADEQVDACRLGQVSNYACLADPEAYRYWVLARGSVEFEMGSSAGLVQHLHTAAQDLSDDLPAFDAAAPDPRVFAVLRENYRLRAEIAAERIRVAVECFQDLSCSPTAGPTTMDADPNASGSIAELLNLLRDDIRGATTLNDFSAAFDVRGQAIAVNFGLQAGFAGDTLYTDIIPAAFTAQGNITDNLTHQELADALFGAGGELEQGRIEVDASVGTFITDPVDRAYLAEIMFYVTASSAPVFNTAN